MADTLAQARHDLAVANRIVSHEGIIDAFGHVSIRHPTNPNRYLISRSRSPELVEPDDILEFTLDSVPGGTRMSFVQHFTPGVVPHPEWGADPGDHPFAAVNPWRAGTLTGWHLAFAALAQLLSGAEVAEITLDESGLLPVYREHMLATQP